MISLGLGAGVGRGERERYAIEAAGPALCALFVLARAERATVTVGIAERGPAAPGPGGADGVLPGGTRLRQWFRGELRGTVHVGGLTCAEVVDLVVRSHAAATETHYSLVPPEVS